MTDDTVFGDLTEVERLRAIEVLLATPADISEALREELCVYRDTLNGSAAVPLKTARLAAIATLLTTPDDLSAGLEAELYAFRDHVNGIPVPGEYPEGSS